MVVSDHSPCTPDLKKLDSGDFTQAWGGISSLQFGNFQIPAAPGFILPSAVILFTIALAKVHCEVNRSGLRTEQSFTLLPQRWGAGGSKSDTMLDAVVRQHVE